MGISLKVTIFIYLKIFLLDGEECNCPKIMNRVCGKDGKTYWNACLAKCSNTDMKCYGACPCKNTKPTKPPMTNVIQPKV